MIDIEEMIICCNIFFFLIEMIIVNLNTLMLFWGKLDCALKEAITITATWDFY